MGEIEEVFLYTVDDLREVVEENMAARREAADEAEHIIERYLVRITAEQKQAQGVDVVKIYRKQLEEWREEFAQKARQDLDKGVSPAEVFERFSKQLINRISHQPTVAIKKASEEQKHDLLQWAAQLFVEPDNAVSDKTSADKSHSIENKNSNEVEHDTHSLKEP